MALLLVLVYIPEAPSPEPAVVACHCSLAGLASAVVTLPPVTASLLAAQIQSVSDVMRQLSVEALLLAAKAQLVPVLSVAWQLAVKADLCGQQLALQLGWPSETC